MTNRRRRDETVRAIDLFCGAGGLSWGLAQACESLSRDVKLVAVNHWERAIETHERNHSWADHYHAKVEELDPRAVFETERVDIFTGGPQCTHYSNARGGRPVDEQKRASPWHILDWLQKLYVDNFVVENVPEFQSWGPVGADGTPMESKRGETFDAWINALHSLGYSVDWQVLNAADYGDATARERLFIVGRRQHRPSFPEPTHSEDGAVPGTDRWRPAAEIIDWSDRGESIWMRDRPLVKNTMRRIADGLRRHGHEDLEPFADAIGELTKTAVEEMQSDVVAVDDLEDEIDRRDGPFLVETDGQSDRRDGAPGVAYLLRQQSGGRPPSVDDPVPTIATKGAISMVESRAFILPRNGYHRGLHSNPAYDPAERPLHTVTAKNHDGHLVTPYLIQYNGNSGAQSLEEPLPTATTKDRFALCVPELFPYGIDVRFRMLQPRELAAAMGFPEDYEFAGNKTETIEQIGNAVPVNLAKSLCTELLAARDPTIRTYNQPESAPGSAVSDGGIDTTEDTTGGHQ